MSSHSSDEHSRRLSPPDLLSRYWPWIGLLPPLLVAATVWERALNLPFYDQLDASARVAIQVVEGKLRLADLLAQHNEHRLFFSNVVSAVLAGTSRWNVRYEIFVSPALAIANLALLSAIVRLQSASLARWLFPVLSALLLSLSQRWLWGFLHQWYFMILFVLMALWILERFDVGWRPLAGAALCAACSSFSFSAGFCAWGALLVTLWLRGYRRPGYYAVWLLSAALCAALFFYEYDFYFRDRQADPWEALQFLMIYLGNPFVERSGSLLVALLLAISGLALLMANTRYLLRCGVEPGLLAAWGGLAAFALTASALTGWGRLVLGLRAALSARYVPMSTLFWIALCVVSAMAVSHLLRATGGGGRRSPLLYGNLALALCTALLYVKANVAAYHRVLPPSQSQLDCFIAYPEAREPGCLRGLHPHLAPNLRGSDEQRKLLDTIDRLAEDELAIFAER